MKLWKKLAGLGVAAAAVGAPLVLSVAPAEAATSCTNVTFSNGGYATAHCTGTGTITFHEHCEGFYGLGSWDWTKSVKVNSAADVGVATTYCASAYSWYITTS